MSRHVRQVTELVRPLAGRLGSLDIELTERCDNDCVHCCINLPAGDRAARSKEMSAKQIIDLLRQAAELGCMSVRLTGGEPLLRPDFEEIYVSARRLGLKVSLFTNARRITSRLARLWARMPPLAPIEVSVYGMHKESYEAVTRSPGSYAQFRRGVSRLLTNKVPFVVKGALLPPTRQEVTELEEWAATLPSAQGPVSYAMFFDLRHRRDDLAKNAAIESLRASPAEGLAVLTRDADHYDHAMEEFACKFTTTADDRLFPCGAGCSPAIDAYGRAQPCLALRAPEFAVDVLGSSLEDAVRRYADLNELRATDPEYLKRCARCRLRALCDQCPAKSWMEHGTLDTPVEYLCAVAHAQAYHLGWLAEGEKGWHSRDPATKV